MICKVRECKTVLSKVSNLDNKYCLVHQKVIAEKEAIKVEEEEFNKRLKKAIQVTKYVDDIKILDSFKKDFKGKKIEIKEKKKNGKTTYSLFRYT